MQHKNPNTKNRIIIRLNAAAILTMCLLVTACGKKQNNAQSSEPDYSFKRPDFTPDYDNFGVSANPSGVNMTYYSDIYSRGFSWLTDKDTEGTELYLVKSDKGTEADFSQAELISGTSAVLTYSKSGTVTGGGLNGSGFSNTSEVKLASHKVHIENLEKGTAYSYKLGSPAGYYYGAFAVERDNPKEITAIHLSDAQTKDLKKTDIWRQTFVNAVETAGNKLDTVLYNGDQFDQNNSTGNDKEPFRLYRYAKAIDVIQDYKFNVPYMISSGNHEPSTPYCQYLMNDVNYKDNYDVSGAYYSYDYNFAHFVVLNTNKIDNAQISWLQNDLDSASTAKWKIVMMHISPYTTGDHSDDDENRTICQKLAPIFSSKHVDLVLQAHDHTYNKTLPYKWDAAGYTETKNDENVVNFHVENETKDNVVYDKNPNGTYYVTTGAAGHRCGEEEKDGIYAEVVYENGEAKGLRSNKTFLTRKYKAECGKLTQSNQYKPYSFTSSGTTYTSNQDYKVGDLATGNVNARMFGILNLTETTMSYHVYTSRYDDNNQNEVKLFDTLDVLKA